MTDREKLIDILVNLDTYGCEECQKCASFKYDLPCNDKCFCEKTADHLLANGVTIQQWIPVEERLPDLIPCGAGTAYSEAVNVLTSGRKVLTAIWNGTDFFADAEFWEAEGEEITHWTPVLLPLPQPPKEVE